MSLSLSLNVAGPSGSEMEAIEALLNLRFIRDSPTNDDNQRGSTSPTQPQCINRSMKGVALANAKIESDSKVGKTIINLENGNGFIIRRSNGSGVARPYRHLKPPKKRSSYRKDEEHKKMWTSTPMSDKISENCDKSTQTDAENPLPVIQKMEDTISELCTKLKALQESQTDSQLLVNGSPPTPTYSSRRKIRFTDSPDSIMKFEPYSPSDDDDDSEWAESDAKDSPDDDISEHDEPEHRPRFRSVSNVSGGEMVSIGDGHASVPARLMRQMVWSPSTYTNATRKLLTAVFSRRVLATHSLSGKRSPAFPDKPAKNKLNPALVNDIIQTVCEMCNVPENVVRVSITTKCADESKMLRTREKNMNKSKKKENIPPTRRSTSSSTGSSASRR